MKTIKQFFTLALGFTFIGTGTVTMAQNAWVGGTPGAETAWNNPRNWSQNHVPNWSDETVVVPNVDASTGYYPVVDNEVPGIPFLKIDGGAKVTIKRNGVLMVNGESTYNHGIQAIGSVYNYGHLIIEETALDPITGSMHNIHNKGAIALNSQYHEDHSIVAARY